MAEEGAAASGSGSSIAANTGALLVARVVVAALGWAGTLLIVRNLSPDDWGRFTFVFNLLGLMVIVTNIVNVRVAIRGYFEADDPGAFAGSYTILRALLGGLGYLLAVGFVVVAGYPHQVVVATATAGLVVVVATPSIAYDSVFQAVARLRPVAVANVVGQVAQFLLTALLVLRYRSLVILTVPAVVCEVVTIAWKVRSVHRIVQVRYRAQRQAWGQLLKAGVPYAVGGALATVYYAIDTVMLSKMDTFRVVGIYGIAYKFGGVIQFVPLALAASVMGMLVRYWPAQPQAFWSVFYKAMLFLALPAFLICGEFMLFAGPLIRMLYGEVYVPAAMATRLIVVSECVGFFTSLGVTTLVALNRNRMYPIATLLGVIVNVGLNLAVIPRWSYNGAAWDTLVTELIVASVLWAIVVAVPGRTAAPIAMIAKAFVAAALATGAGAAVWQVAPWPAAGVVVAIVYIAFLHLGRIAGTRGLLSLFEDDVEHAT